MSEAVHETTYLSPGEAALQALMHSVAPEDEGFKEFLAVYCGKAGIEEAAKRYDLIIAVAQSAKLPTLVFEES